MAMHLYGVSEKFTNLHPLPHGASQFCRWQWLTITTEPTRSICVALFFALDRAVPSSDSQAFHQDMADQMRARGERWSDADSLVSPTSMTSNIGRC
jgi:hypothetical protein